MKEIKLNIRHENVFEETIFSGVNISVYVDYYWESHGRLVSFPRKGKYQEDFLADKVEIIYSKYDEYMDDRCIIEDCEAYKLYINGEFIGDVDSYDDSEEDALYVDVVVGGS